MLVNNKIEEQPGRIAKSYKFADYIVKIFIFIFAFILIYTFYRSEIIYKSALSYYYTKYYIISSIGIFFWIIILKLKDEIKLKVVMVTTSFIVALYLVEIILQFFTPHLSQFIKADAIKIKESITKKAEVNFDTRTKYQVYKDLKDKGMEVVPATFTSYFIKFYNNSQSLKIESDLYPLGGVSKKTTILCNENGEYSIYESDRFGFNNPDSEWDKSQIDWVLIGDSFVHGACVSSGQEISEQIRVLTNKNVINLGMGGSGPLIELAILKEYGKFVRPKKVLWFFLEKGDLEDLESEKTFSLLTNYLKPEFSQNLISRQTEVNQVLKYFIKKFEFGFGMDNSKASQVSKKIKTNEEATEKNYILWKTRILRLKNLRDYIGFDRRRQSFDFELFAKVLKEAEDQVKAWDGKLYFVYLTQFCKYTIACPLHHSTNTKRKEVLEIVKGLNIPIIDMHKEVFAKHPDPLSLFPFRLIGHYNAEGYREVSKVIVSKFNN